ncbi:hypothetical protein TNCV_2208691 [Trichonephila clavipes]|nr:hypothetical protein TNCV_2208691 [Trichonephila clavipes]
MHCAFTAWGTLNCRRAASPLRRLIEKDEKGKALTTPKVFYHQIEVETSQIVQSPACCSKLRITTGVQSSSLP